MSGTVRVTGTIFLGKGSVTDDAVADSTTLDSDKLEHLHKAGSDFGLDSDATPVAHTKTIYVCEAATATIRGFHCLLTDTGTSTDVDFDLLKNGTTTLSAAVKVTNADADRAVKDGTLSASALVAGDVLTVDLAVTSSTGALGPYCWVEVDESAG